MKSFSDFMSENALGNLRGDDEMVGTILGKLAEFREFEREVERLVNRITVGHEAMTHAAKRWVSATHALEQAIRSTFGKNAGSPEYADHPPISDLVS